jgi:Ca2+-binding RTX toxin-like protein
MPATVTGSGTIVGTDGPDVIVGSTGNDTILGLGVDDVICGDLGNDSIVGGEGNDLLIGDSPAHQRLDQPRCLARSDAL